MVVLSSHIFVYFVSCQILSTHISLSLLFPGFDVLASLVPSLSIRTANWGRRYRQTTRKVQAWPDRIRTIMYCCFLIAFIVHVARAENVHTPHPLVSASAALRATKLKEDTTATRQTSRGVRQEPPRRQRCRVRRGSTRRDERAVIIGVANAKAAWVGAIIRSFPTE